MKSVIFCFSITKSSVSDYFLELCNRLSEKFRVTIITDRLEEHNFPIDPRIEILRWPSPRPVHFKDFVFLYKVVRRLQPAAILGMFGSVNLTLLVGLLCSVPVRMTWSHTISSAFPSNRFAKIRKIMILRTATHILANSKATRQDLIEYYKVPSDKIKVVYNAVSVPQGFSHIVPDRNQISFVGRIHKSKNVEVLIEALPAVLKEFPDVVLHLAGGDSNGGQIKEHKKRALDLGIGSNVIFHGTQTKQQVLKLFRSSWFSVVPSWVEGFGFVVIESFSVETPVIGSNTSGVAETVRDQENGFLFDPASHQELSVKMIALLSDQDLRDKLSKNAYQNFLENYEVQKSTDTFKSWFTEVCDAAGK